MDELMVDPGGRGLVDRGDGMREPDEVGLPRFRGHGYAADAAEWNAAAFCSGVM